MGLGAALIEAGDGDSANRRAAAGHAAGRDVDRSSRSLERDAVTALITRLKRLRRELQGAIATAGGAPTFRAFTAQSLIAEIDRLILDATADLTTTARGAFLRAEDLGVAAVDEPLKGARLAATGRPGLDRSLAVTAFDTTADQLTEPMQVFRNKVVAGVRRAAIAGSSSFDELRKLAVSIDTAGMDAAQFKAERIVRTELGRVFTGATYDRMLGLEHDFPFLRKGWKSARDSRTRQGHLDASSTYARGSGIPIGDKFRINVYAESKGKLPTLLGVALLRYALDPEATPAGRLAAGATIMCRCFNFVDFDLAELRAFSTKRSLALTPGAPAPVLIPGEIVPAPVPPARAPRKVKTVAPVTVTIKAPALPATSSGAPQLDPALHGPGRELGVNQTWLSHTLDNSKDRISEDLAFELGRDPTAEELAAHVDKLDRFVQDLIKRADLHSRVTPETLVKILEDGRFKSQFETQTSRGMFDPDFRATVEKTMWGLPTDLPVEQRPIYGYLSEGEGGGYSTGTYGSVAIKFKPGVRDRATFTFGDSFGHYGIGRAEVTATAPAPISAPRAYAWNWNRPTGYAKKGGKADELLRSPKVDRLGGGLPYTEAQIFGGVKVSDIEEVVFERGTFDVGAITPALDKAGIPWRILDR